MSSKLENQALKVLNLVSKDEQKTNRYLPKQTKKLLEALQNLKTATK